ncbi:MAG: sensor histidine kinase, partial [Paraclostridium sp.]
VNIKLAQSRLEYKKGNYEAAINICENIIEELELTGSSQMMNLVMKQLRIYYIITENKNLNKLNEDIEKYEDYLKNDVAKLYLKNNINEVKNIKLIKQKYDITINVIIFCLLQLIVLTILIIRYKEKRRKNEILEKDIELINNQFKYQFNHYENLKTHQEEVRILWHDMKNHVNILIGLLEANNNEELGKYLYKLNRQITKANSNLITKNKIIDAILSSKIELCKNKNIELNIDAKLPEDIGIQDIDVCIILGNLIDNAIEACDRIENDKRYINLSIGTKNNYVYIKIENSKNNTISKHGGNILTSKEDKVNHGLGIKSINKSLEKYDGSIKFNYDDDTFEVFITMKKR